MDWSEVFVALVVCHVVGDYLLQTDWQARNKHGGLMRGPGTAESRRALFAHVAIYTLAFVPVFAALWDSLGAGVLGVAALVAVPHLIQDDGRGLMVYILRVKRCDADTARQIFTPVDQSFHLVALFLVALVAGS
ncbi:MAG: DUF3307 domain-containing protein [Thermoleophilaceae bacterium]